MGSIVVCSNKNIFLFQMAAKHEKGEDTSSSDEEEAGKEIPQHDADSIEDQQEVRLLDNTSSCLENSNQDDNYPPPGWNLSGRRIQQCTDDIPTGIGDDDVCTIDLCEEEECRAAQENDYVDQLTDDIKVFISLLIISLYLRALSNNFIN
ncbi:unnamed protein product [Pocillopora meandrina]|uniref:Uncharacterized protein n=1 Tax=Pocillopora meandrina TaxID=46732 RepID=A0AAU9Y2D8_9CNID|nr:unnamed protein product [Pocillopora meandrina]